MTIGMKSGAKDSDIIPFNFVSTHCWDRAVIKIDEMSQTRAGRLHAEPKQLLKPLPTINDLERRDYSGSFSDRARPR
eukprot:scaffold39417_cov239-Skeletonema_dohrnii-CCMP3373.AAC.1